MAKYIRRERLATAITSLAEWRTVVHSQASSHLFPFIALLEKGASSQQAVRFEESDDYAFFNKYFRVPADKDNPYFDPLVRRRRISTHPHSNAATARIQTFQRSWGAATSDVRDGETYWRLSGESVDILRRKVLTRAGETNRVNVLDVAVWLFRHEEFPDNADAQALERRFRERFHLLEGNDYDQLFEFNDEPPENIFSADPLAESDVREVVDSLEVTRSLSN
jgi:hypothetical protein